MIKLFKWSLINRVKFVVICRCSSTVSYENTRREQMTMDKALSHRSDPVVKKINSNEFSSIFTENLNQLISLFDKYKYELRIAGGAVRDLLLENVPTDIDLATTATPTQMKDMFEKENIRMINTNGERHGTITPRINDKQNFEITTLRIDVLTNGRHAEVQFTTDWQLDAYRRDLTINSMFLGFDGTVYDYFNGYEDLMNRRVRFVGEPAQRIQEDYLRILRYFRFYGRIATSSCDHDQKTLDAIKANISGLEKVSGERIWMEMKKIFLLNMRGELIQTFLECGAAKYIGLPEDIVFDDFRRITENSSFDKQPLLAISYMSAFLQNSEDAMRLHQRLKLSAYERDLAYFLPVYREAAREADDLLYYKRMCVLIGKNQNITKEYVLELLKYNGKLDLFEQLQVWSAPRFPITGIMLQTHGCSKGRMMGLVMNELKDIWANGNFEMTAEELLKELPIVLNELNRSNDGMVSKKPKMN
ncbi:CCA tRNA nucleotidyltransferase 1, mitochondrial isoform X1 [Bradysia coprophila]|uniref:CCA tRNA nucleotidyltransferase 1, mitochondrial isoform X1 n=2 Tax=Bradysia coprophila TaxID=38358 RepID=UPI00187DCAC9|nr:CCA tRNA nucleotidyltransferase 1, mitochondrial isoform X1 [Bradysia coprophila]